VAEPARDRLYRLAFAFRQGGERHTGNWGLGGVTHVVACIVPSIVAYLGQHEAGHRPRHRCAPRQCLFERGCEQAAQRVADGERRPVSRRDRLASPVELPRAVYHKPSGTRRGEPTAAIRGRVERARDIQARRLTGSRLTCNADMGPAEVRKHCELDETGRSLLRTAAQQLQLSARTYHRLLKVSRTVADLAGSERSQTTQLAEAIQYRQRKQ